MPLSIEHRPDETRAIATVHAALDAGVTLIDTADSYHWHAGGVRAVTRPTAPAATATTCDDVTSSTPSPSRRTSGPTANDAAALAVGPAASTRRPTSAATR
jgi:hypothetical protein